MASLFVEALCGSKAFQCKVSVAGPVAPGPKLDYAMSVQYRTRLRPL